MMAKPIKTLELHYLMIQFLICLLKTGLLDNVFQKFPIA